MDSSASKLRSFIKWIRKERSQNNSIVQKALETNLRRMYYLALVVIPMHIAYVVMFWITEPSSGKEAVWRTGIIVVHSIHLIVSLALAIIISRAKRQNHLSNKAVFIQYAFIVSLSAMAISLVTIDQHVTTNITPFLVLCLGLAVIFLLRPTSAFIIFSVVLTAYLLLIGIVQKEPAILLTNRVNGITFVVFGMYLSLILWNTTRKNLFQEEEIKRQQKELEEKNAELQRLAFFDTLTGLYNRRKWFEFAEEESRLICRYNIRSSVVLMDIDHFKKINDDYGHPIGDKILKEIADLLKKNLRAVNKLCRWGGEEFIFLLPNTSVEEARKVAEKLRTLIERAEFSIDGESIRVKASFGIASIKCEENPIDRAYERVDRALYMAKQGGRNIVVSET